MKKQQKFFRNPSVSFADSIPQFAMVVPLRSQVRLRLSRLSVQHGRSASSHRPALTLARCSVAAHCALLRVLTTSALRAFGCSQARLRRSLVPTIRNSRLATLPLASLLPLLLYKSPKTEAASRGAGQLIAKVVQWKGNGLTDHPKSFALATESVSQPSIVQRSICAGRVPSGTLESANR